MKPFFVFKHIPEIGAENYQMKHDNFLIYISYIGVKFG